jgi:hypothetical protein
MIRMGKELELPESEINEIELEPTEEQLKLFKKELARLFVLDDRINIKTEKKALEKATGLVSKSLEDWGTGSARTFRSKLIACISSFGSKNNRVGKEGAEKMVDEVFTRAAPLLNMESTCSTSTEKEFISRRLEKYFEEYEFNKTSDITLLRQLISLEYIALRLEYAQRQNWRTPMKYNTALQSIENRMMKLMEKFGVARFQREDEIGEATNIAELAMSYDSKKKRAEEEKMKDRFEIEQFMKLRKERGYDEVNEISDSEFDILEKRSAETEKIDPKKFFDLDDLGLMDLDKLVDKDSNGKSTKNKNTQKKQEKDQ